MTCLKATLLVTVCAGTIFAGSAVSNPGSLDTSSGSITLLPNSKIAYSTIWHNGDKVVVSAMNLDDASLVEAIKETSETPEEGVCSWDYTSTTLPKNADYLLSHQTYVGEQPLMSYESAVVSILPEPVLALAIGLVGLLCFWRRRFAALLLLVVSVSMAADVTVGNVKFAQRWPWNGLVDIDYSIASAETFPLVKVSFEAKIGEGEFFALATLRGDAVNGYVYENGTYRTTWNATADKPGVVTDALVIRVTAVDDPEAYMCLDLADITGGAMTFHASAPDLTVATNKDRYLWMRKIPACTFKMGSEEGEPGRTAAREFPHTVKLTKDYYIGLTELPLTQYNRIIGSSSTSLNPVANISYDMLRGADSPWPADYTVTSASTVGKLRAKAAQALAEVKANTGVEWIFDLPTEAQWECAAKSGTFGTWNDGSAILASSGEDNNLTPLAWYATGGGSRQFVAQKLPNKWGLYDMHGNMYEWCLDWFQTDASSLATVNPRGPLTSPETADLTKDKRVQKGGDYSCEPQKCRAALRVCNAPDTKANGLSVRLAMVQDVKEGE